MLVRWRYIMMIGIAALCTIKAGGQSEMPDHVCTGQSGHYFVDPNPGSTYAWRIDGVVQLGFTTNQFDHTWNRPGTFLLELQEYSADGCPGPVRWGYVYVSDQVQYGEIEIPSAFSPNGDLINDAWIISGIDNYPEAIITIYNRWGQQVWRSLPGYPVPWDGRSNGRIVPMDSYHYVMVLNNRSKPVVGTVTVVR